MKAWWPRRGDQAPEDAPSATEAARETERPPRTDAARDASVDRDPRADAVPGERGIAFGRRTRSLQSRLNNLLAVGVMALLGVGLLLWYYTQALSRPTQEQAAARAAVKAKSSGEMVLPALGRIDPPVIERVLGPRPPPPTLNPVASDAHPAIFAATGAAAASPAKSPAQLAFERRLAGPVFVSDGTGSRAVPPPSGSDRDEGSMAFVDGARDPPPANASGNGELPALLEPSVTPAVHANLLPTQRLLLPKGAFLDCTLETAIDSTLPGMTTCITATDTFGADGRVVLLERGTKLVGETRGEVRQGASRVFVLWTEARTPTGVVVPLASPGTDELGRSGLPGEVDRHFWARFGAAILISVIDGAVQAAVQSGNDGDTVIVNPSGSREIMTEVLRNTIRLPPTVTKPQGDRIAVLVARDLDFRSVYELRPAR